MENDIANLWEFAYWGFGICAVGFFALLGSVAAVWRKMSQVISVEAKINTICTSIREIEKAMTGGYSGRGLIPRQEASEKLLTEHEKRISQLEKK